MDKEVVIKKIEKNGKIEIPEGWRKGWNDKVELRKLPDGRVIIRPIGKRPMRLTDLFDSIEIDIPPEDFEDVHKLKRRLLE